MMLRRLHPAAVLLASALVALGASFLVAARTRLGAVLSALSSYHGVHIGDPGAVVWAMALATLGTARTWALSRS